MTTAFEAEARRMSDSVIASERVGQNFDRALYVALEDEVEVLDASLLDLFGEALERNAR